MLAGRSFVVVRKKEGVGHIKRSTITDVAKLAQVSIKTVSRVVRREPNVSDKTRVAVEEAIASLNYRPTISARSTTGARSFMLGLVFDNPSPSYTFQLMIGAQRAMRENGYQLVFEPLEPNSKNRGEAIIDLVIQCNLEGVIVSPPLCDDPSVLEALSKLNRPFVRIAPGRQHSIGFGVSMDEYGAARAMTSYLLELGHTRIGHIMGRKDTAASQKRCEGYLDALKDAGIEHDMALVLQGDFEMQSGVACGEALLELADPPTAIFAANDHMAAGVLMVAHRRGLSVPKDLSVAGFDDSEVASTMWLPLTTIRQPIEELAATAARCIIEHQRNKGGTLVGNIQLDYNLIIRDSTGPAPARR